MQTLCIQISTSERLSLSYASSRRIGGALAWFVPAPAVVALARGDKLGILVHLTIHKILENRKFIANSQRFAERSGKRGKAKLMLFKLVFVDLQGSNLRFQSRGRNAELGCGTPAGVSDQLPE